MTETVTSVDHAFARARAGDTRAFAEWMGRVERPIRLSLRRFARVVDVEVVMQETFLRMWLVATRRPERNLEGPNAALRFAVGVARNVALEEMRRARISDRVALEDAEGIPEMRVDPEPASSPALARAIRECLGRLPARGREAILARIADGHRLPDVDLAARLHMTRNTFLQNIVRARRALEACLQSMGFVPHEVVP